MRRCLGILVLAAALVAQSERTVRVFVFAGQSNMVGSDSKVRDIARFPPFAGVGAPRREVRFAYCIGRQNPTRSKGWVPLAPVNQLVGPELSFARKVTRHIDAPIAIIKVAAGGTHLCGDWNPDAPEGFKLYPRALSFVKSALAELTEKGVRFRIEGFVWHQGENDMFKKGCMSAYGKNLARFLACWRRDLGVPKLRFYIGELCCKTIWGMDLRPRMYAISVGQRAVTDADPLADYVPTSHIGVEIGNPVGLHYHYGTLGQLEHGENYADAYLRSLGKLPSVVRKLRRWPYKKGSKVSLFVLAGHRNMEGERAFVQELAENREWAALRHDQPDVAFLYDVGGGFKRAADWEPLGPIGYYDTFGPELTFAARLKSELGNIAIAKFTHSGSQIVDWSPAGSAAKSRNLYPRFRDFVRSAKERLEARGHTVDLAGIFYHVGENDMSFGPHRSKAAAWIGSLIAQLRADLALPRLRWFVTQQRPTDHERVNTIDVTAQLAGLARDDPGVFHWKMFDLPGCEQRLVIRTPGILELGDRMARDYLRLVR